MIELFKKSSKTRIGLDITPEGITMIVLGAQNKKNSLKHYIYKPFTKQPSASGQIENFEVVTEGLKSIIEEYAPDTRDVVFSVPSSVVFVKKIILPDLPEDELKIIAPQEAAKHLPMSVKEMNVDFQILENTRTHDESGKKMDVILCALSKTIARTYLEAISSAGFQASAIDISCFSMIRALSNAELINEPGKTYVSALIDYAGTDINVIQDGMPVFSHNIQTGKKNIVENIANSLSRKKAEVLEMLPEVALMIPGAEMNENPNLNKASNAARSVYSSISGEIQKTVEFFNSENPEPVEIERVFLGGSGVCVQNIDKYIFNKLKIDTCIFNPFINVSEELQNQENLLSPVNIPSFSTSVGLAIKGSGN